MQRRGYNFFGQSTSTPRLANRDARNSTESNPHGPDRTAVLSGVAGERTMTASAAGEFHNQPHQQCDWENHERREEAQDDQPFEALRVADQRVHGVSVVATAAAGSQVRRDRSSATEALVRALLGGAHGRAD